MMASVTVDLPSMLANVIGGVRHVDAQGTTCKEVLDDTFARHPELKVHIVDEQGALRQHVLCFVNEVNTRWEAGLDQPVQDGDRLTIMQAVSGG